MMNFILSKEIAFVHHPRLRGLWIRTHPCVVLVACPDCKSEKGEPCKGHMRTNHGYSSGPHWKRKKAAEGVPIELNFINVVIGDQYGRKDQTTQDPE